MGAPASSSDRPSKADRPGPPGALAGLRVLEVADGIAPAYATKLLGDLGAEVIMAEPPSGDRLRHENADLFAFLHEGKRSAVVDSPAGLGAIVGWADLVMTTGGVPAALGEVDGARVLVRITPFGRPLLGSDAPVTDLTLQAMGGWVSAHGIPGYPPVKVGGMIPEYVAGTFAACAALTADRAAADLGRPVIAELSVLECLVGTLAYPMLFLETLTALGLGLPEGRYSVLPGIVRCRDGWVGINALTGQHWQDICALLEAPEFAGAQRDLGWGGPELERFFDRVQPWLDLHSVEEVVDRCQLMRIPAAPVGDGRSLPRLAQFRARPFYRPGPPVRPGPPYRLSETPAAAGEPAPRLGQHTREVIDLVSAGLARGEGRRGSVGPAAYLPFAGLRVVDLGTFWAGPYIGLYLGAMGADVIKIESVRRPDGFRFSAAFPQEGDDWYERSGLWQATNLNKRGVTLDLADPDCLLLLRRLLTGADILIENFSPRVLEEFGLGYPQVRELRPDIIMVRMPGFGLEGPWRDYVGWAMSFEQTCGMAQVTGDGTRPINPGGFLDPVVGMHGAVAIQAALRHRQRTGEGQLIELAQIEVGAHITAEQVIEYARRGRVLAGEGNRDRFAAPQGVYRCAPDPGAAGRLDGEWVAVSVRDDDDWAALVDVLGAAAWAADPALRTVGGRQAAHDVLDAGIEQWTRTRTPGEVVAALRPKGVPVATLLTAPLMYGEPHLAARAYYQELVHSRTGPCRYPGWPMQFSFGPAQPHRFGAPTLGQHNAEVLGGLLGVEADELERLRAAGVIGERLIS